MSKALGWNTENWNESLQHVSGNWFPNIWTVVLDGVYRDLNHQQRVQGGLWSHFKDDDNFGNPHWLTNQEFADADWQGAQNSSRTAPDAGGSRSHLQV